MLPRFEEPRFFLQVFFTAYVLRRPCSYRYEKAWGDCRSLMSHHRNEASKLVISSYLARLPLINNVTLKYEK